MAEPSTHINYSFEDIQRYLQGKMSAAEMHALEKAALQDSFLSDAIEGYREVSSTIAQQHLNEINAALQEEKQDSKIVPLKKNNQWLRIAAIIILLAGAGIIGTYFLKRSDKQNQIAQVKKEDANKKSITKDSIATVKAETSLVNKNTAPVIAQSKKKQNVHPLKKIKASKPYISADTNNEIETTSIASLNINPEKISEADRAFAPVPLSAPKNNDSAQYFLRAKTSGLNVTAVNTFTGKVVDENNEPIVGTAVQIKDKKKASFTDQNGNFVLQDSGSMLNVNADIVGYESKSALLQKGNKNTIVLQKNAEELNETLVRTAKPAATPVGGWENFNNYVVTKLNEDSTNKENRMSYNDIVELEFLIDNNGNPYNIKVIKPLDNERNSKAIDILRTGPRWTNPSKNKKAKVAITF